MLLHNIILHSPFFQNSAMEKLMRQHWMILETFLFGLIGAAVDLKLVDPVLLG